MRSQRTDRLAVLGRQLGRAAARVLGALAGAVDRRGVCELEESALHALQRRACVRPGRAWRRACLALRAAGLLRAWRLHATHAPIEWGFRLTDDGRIVAEYLRAREPWRQLSLPWTQLALRLVPLAELVERDELDELVALDQAELVQLVGRWAR